MDLQLTLHALAFGMTAVRGVGAAHSLAAGPGEQSLQPYLKVLPVDVVRRRREAERLIQQIALEPQLVVRRLIGSIAAGNTKALIRRIEGVIVVTADPISRCDTCVDHEVR